MTEVEICQASGSERINRRQINAAIALRRAAQIKRAIAEPAGERSLRVLVIDDDEDTAESLSRLVRLWGHDVRKALTGESGLDVARMYRPDVVLLDVGIPSMDGCALARRVRLDSRLQACFIVAITGYSDERQRASCHRAGIDLLLVKPVDPVVLETLLELEEDYVNRSPK